MKCKCEFPKPLTHSTSLLRRWPLLTFWYVSIQIFFCLNAKHELSLLDTEEVSRTIVCPECKVSNASRLRGVVCVCESLSPVCLFGTPWDCIPSGFSVHGLLQARTLEWVAALLPRRSYQTQGLNLGVSRCRWILYSLSHQESPCRVPNKA